MRSGCVKENISPFNWHLALVTMMYEILYFELGDIAVVNIHCPIIFCVFSNFEYSILLGTPFCLH